MEALDDSPRPGREREITAEARVWLVSLGCQKPKEWVFARAVDHALILLGEQHIDRLDRADLATLELLDNVIERLQRAWHTQADQVISDPLDRCWGQRVNSHAAASFAARRLPTAS
jgi:hypothetical protein